jgi:hypothetical protein
MVKRLFDYPDLNGAPIGSSVGAISPYLFNASNLADLYDAASMPADLRRAHQALDAAVDRLYRREPFGSDRERVEFLLARYERERAPLVVDAQPPRRRRRRA